MRFVILFLVLLIDPASAQVGPALGLGGGPGHVAAASYSGAGDVFSGAKLWVGLRAYTSATRGNALINACNSTGGVDVLCADLSSNATTGALVSGTIGGITCPGTNCTIKTWYNQGSLGSGNNCTQATVASRATLNASILGSLPAAIFGTVAGYTCGTGAAIAEPFTISVVVNRTGSFSSSVSVLGADNASTTYNYIFFSNSAGTDWALGGSSGTVIVGTVTQSAFHSAVGITNGSSSTLNIDAIAQGTGTLSSTGIASGDTFHLGSDGYVEAMTGDFTEGGVWPTAAGSPANLISNERAYWGF